MSLTYKDAGVDIEAADDFVKGIGKLAQDTDTRGEVVKHENAFASLLRPDLTGMSQPILAAACDGVGTKVLVARDHGSFEGLGQDLVAMQVNDLLPSGARPLLFLDYIATGKLDPEQLTAVVRGAAAACKDAGCVLLGGETAEMPGVYQPGDFDLAGFAVGVVDEARIPKDGAVANGDVCFGLTSSGVHSNGLSLARKALLDRAGMSLSDTPDGLERSLGDTLLEPTKIYVREVLALHEKLGSHIHKSAHITGGGLLGRGAKLVPEGLRLTLSPESYPRPLIFDLIARAGDVSPEEMSRTFNMGLGYLAVVSPEGAEILRKAPGPWLEVGSVSQHPEGGIDLGYARS